jgi:hypothetical protein
MAEIESAPGPWSYGRPESAGGWCVIYDATGNEVGSGDGGYEEADARLITASHELLEALKEIIDTPWLGGKGGFARARAAIAKATLGESHDSEEL